MLSQGLGELLWISIWIDHTLPMSESFQSVRQYVYRIRDRLDIS